MIEQEIRAEQARLQPKVRPFDLVAGVPFGGLHLATAFSLRTGIPVVYEVRAFWEDAAADHGTAREGGLRYRLTRAVESFALRRADAVTTICEGLRREIVARGIPVEASKKSIYSRDRNLWHLSHEGGELESTWNEPRDRMLMLSVPIEKARYPYNV